MRECSITIPVTEWNPQSRDMHYLEWNPDCKRVIICVHGLSRNARDFDFVAEHLSDNFRVISVDIAGRGNSDWLDDRKLYNYATYVEDIKYLLDSLKIKEIYWLGSSMGALLALHFIHKYPDILKKLVLNDVGPSIPVHSLNRIYRYVGKMPEFATLADASKHLRMKLTTFGIKQESHWDHVVKYSIAHNPNGKYRFNYDPKIVPTQEEIDLFKHLEYVEDWNLWDDVKIEMLLLRGAKSDILDDRIVARMSENKHLDYIVTFPDVGHAPMLMDEDQIEYVYNWFNDYKLPHKYLSN